MAKTWELHGIVGQATLSLAAKSADETVAEIGPFSVDISSVVRRPRDAELWQRLAPITPVEMGGLGTHLPDLSAVRVRVSRAEGPAPHGVSFQLESDDPHFWALLLYGTVEWTFSQRAAEAYTYWPLAGTRYEGDTAEYARGPFVGHVYVDAPAYGAAPAYYDHEWSVTLWYAGQSRTITHLDGATDTKLGGTPCGAIRVWNDDAWFTIDRTVYYSNEHANEGDFYAALAAAEAAEAGSSGIAYWSDYDDASRPAALLQKLRCLEDGEMADWFDNYIDNGAGEADTQMQRARIARGTTTVLDTRAKRLLMEGNARLDAFGIGARPILDASALDEANVHGVLRAKGVGNQIIGLDMRGPFDPLNPSWGFDPGLDASGIMFDDSGCADNTLFDLAITGFKMLVESDESAPRCVIANCNLSGWFNYGLFPGNMRDGVLRGCFIGQPEGTVTLGREDPGAASNTAARFNYLDSDSVHRNCAVHGPLRIGGGPDAFGFLQCVLRSLNGWSRDGGYDQGRSDLAQVNPNAYAIQPAARLGTILRGQGASYNVWRVDPSGKSMGSAWQTDSAARVDENPSNEYKDDSITLPLAFLIHDCPLDGPDGGMTTNYGRMHITNCLFSTDFESKGSLSLVGQDTHTPDVIGGIVQDPITVSHCTLVYHPQGPFTGNFFDWIRYGTEYEGPGSASLRRQLGYDNALVYLGPEGGIPADLVPPPLTDMVDISAAVGGAGVAYAPGPASNLLGKGLALAPRYDFVGNLRGTRPTPGAFEAAPAMPDAAPQATLRAAVWDNAEARTLVMWLSGLTGSPRPTASLDVCTLDGADLLPSVQGRGTADAMWWVEIPMAASGPIVVTASASNGVGADWTATDNTISVSPR